MRRILLLFFTLLNLQAETIEARYTLSYWILDDIAVVTLRYVSEKGRYHIDAEAKLQGVTAVLANHHVERHHSEGRVDAAGRLIPERYDAVRTYDGYVREQHYRFDHKRKRVLQRQTEERTRTERRFDAESIRFVSERKTQEHHFERVEPFYAPDDLLTLYFNARKSLKSMPPNSRRIFPAVGSRNGKVTVSKKSAPLAFGLIMDQDIFRSKAGEMDLQMDEAFYVVRSVLKDVLLFGDLKVERVYLKREP